MGEIASREQFGGHWNALQAAIGSCIIGDPETNKTAGCSQGSMDMAQGKTTASSLQELQAVASKAAALPPPCRHEVEAFLQTGTTPPRGEENDRDASPACGGDSKTALPRVGLCLLEINLPKCEASLKGMRGDLGMPGPAGWLCLQQLLSGTRSSIPQTRCVRIFCILGQEQF